VKWLRALVFIRGLLQRCRGGTNRAVCLCALIEVA
jgi:hypothetical protein